MKPEILNNPAVYPPAEVLKRCEFINDVGEATEVYDRLWTEIKSESQGGETGSGGGMHAGSVWSGNSAAAV